MAIDWDPDMKKKYYDENEAEVGMSVVMPTQRLSMSAHTACPLCSQNAEPLWRTPSLAVPLLAT